MVANDTENDWASTSVQTLTTTIAGATIFESDFETGDLTQWTGSLYSGGSTAPTVQQSLLHHGNYSFTSNCANRFGYLQCCM